MTIKPLSPALYQKLTVGWALLIFLASSIPSLHVDQSIPEGDKFVHVAIFAVLAYLLSGALQPITRALDWRTQIALMVLITTAFGLLDECHQLMVMGRVFSLWDLLADGIGSVIGAISFKMIHNNEALQAIEQRKSDLSPNKSNKQE